MKQMMTARILGVIRIIFEIDSRRSCTWLSKEESHLNSGAIE
jgi:hypothetical protein